MNEATQQLILAEIVKGENGVVKKTEANTALLQEFVGQTLDCRFDFTRTQTSLDEDGIEIEEEITEDMYCGVFKESSDGLSYLIERDKLGNYGPDDVYPDYKRQEDVLDEEGNVIDTQLVTVKGENVLETLNAKEKIVL